MGGWVPLRTGVTRRRKRKKRILALMDGGGGGCARTHAPFDPAPLGGVERSLTHTRTHITHPLSFIIKTLLRLRLCGPLTDCFILFFAWQGAVCEQWRREKEGREIIRKKGFGRVALVMATSKRRQWPAESGIGAL